MSDASLRETYLAYLDALNERRFGDLAHYVHDDVTYNNQVLTRDEYAAMIAADTEAVPDLHFDADLLLTHDDVVACRLWFDCTPVRPFLGLMPTGRRITFGEHVFYRFQAGRIANVWSLIDRDAVAAQLPDQS